MHAFHAHPFAARARVAAASAVVMLSMFVAGAATAQARAAGGAPASSAAAAAASEVVVSPRWQARYDAAHAEYEVGHFDAAFAAFVQLADEGHCDAARIARQMVRFGRQLYAAEFRASPQQLARWQALPCPTALATR